MFSPETPTAQRRRVVGVLLVAIVAVSSSAVILKSIEGVDSTVLAFWRTTMVAALLLPAVRSLSASDARRIFLAGACLAGHFAVWFASLNHTTVMRSTVLVALSPLWAALLEWLFLQVRPTRRYWTGMAVCAPGIALLTLAGNDAGQAGWYGDMLAALGGMLGAAYLVLGRSVRERVGIGTYACLVCAAASVVLLPTAVAMSAPLWGWDTQTWLLIGALAAGPQLFGHNGFNYALRWLPAATVSAAMLMEPVGATMLALMVLGEIPGPMGAAGALFVVGGVLYGTWDAQTPAG